MADFKLKLVLTGPAAVGKTSLLHRFVNNQFSSNYSMTIGVDFLVKNIEIGKSDIVFSIWDIGGQRRFNILRRNFYSGAQGALLIFDLTRSTTFEEMGKWYTEITQFAGNIPFILVGNKKDLLDTVGNVIEKGIAKKFAEQRDSIYIETSAKTGENVESAFVELAKKITNKLGFKL